MQVACQWAAFRREMRGWAAREGGGSAAVRGSLRSREVRLRRVGVLFTPRSGTLRRRSRHFTARLRVTSRAALPRTSQVKKAIREAVVGGEGGGRGLGAGL